MNSDSKFAILYRKMHQESKEADLQVRELTIEGVSLQELQEIDELRRLSQEISQPAYQFFTGT